MSNTEAACLGLLLTALRMFALFDWLGKEVLHDLDRTFAFVSVMTSLVIFMRKRLSLCHAKAAFLPASG
jgi:hypothetical protein